MDAYMILKLGGNIAKTTSKKELTLQWALVVIVPHQTI